MKTCRIMLLCSICLLGCHTQPNGGLPLVVDGRVSSLALNAAGLPESVEIPTNTHPETFRVDFTRAISLYTLTTDIGSFQAIVHPAEYGDAYPDRVSRRTPRVCGYGLPLIYGHGPVTVWRGDELWIASGANAPWSLLDTGQSYGPLLIVMHDNIGAEGPLELHISGKRPDSGPPLVWLDIEAKGCTYVLRQPAGDGKGAFELEMYECLGNKTTFKGTLTKDVNSKEILLQVR